MKGQNIISKLPLIFEPYPTLLFSKFVLNTNEIINSVPFVFQSTVASKFLSLTESVRDAADLYLSLKHPPVVFINDTPRGFVRHMECRDPAIAQELWGSTAGCFQTPTLHQDPEGVCAFCNGTKTM